MIVWTCRYFPGFVVLLRFCYVADNSLFFTDVTTCGNTQIANSVSHETSGSVKSIQNGVLVGAQEFECKAGYYKTGAVGGKMVCTGTTWTPSACLTLAQVQAQELASPNTFLFTNYGGGTLRINIDRNLNNIKIGIVAYESTTVIITGINPGQVSKVITSSYNTITVSCSVCASGAVQQSPKMHPTAYSDPMGNGNIFCLHSGGTGSQGGCAAKGQTVAKFEQLFGEQIDRVQCQYGTWNDDKYQLDNSNTGMSFRRGGTSSWVPGMVDCPGESCPPSGCPTATPELSASPNPTCQGFSCGSTHFLKSNAPSITCGAAQCTASECCDANPTCQGFSSCGPTKHLKGSPASIQCSTSSCQVSECCNANPTCQSYSCPSTHLAKSSPASITCTASSCTTQMCCNSKPTCQGFSRCGSAQHLKDSPAGILCSSSTCEVSECCDSNPTCQGFSRYVVIIDHFVFIVEIISGLSLIVVGILLTQFHPLPTFVVTTPQLWEHQTFKGHSCRYYLFEFHVCSVGMLQQ